MLHLPRPIVRRGLLAAILSVVLAAAAVAQEPAPPAAPGSALTAAERNVRDAVLARFRVLPVQNGIVLVPLSRIQGVDNIELREGTIAINGHPATGGEVRQALGRDAGPVLELSVRRVGGPAPHVPFVGTGCSRQPPTPGGRAVWPAPAARCRAGRAGGARPHLPKERGDARSHRRQRERGG